MRTPLGEVNRMATGPLAAGFADADRHPPVFDPATGTVALLDSLRTAFQVLGDGGWWRLGAAFRYLAGPAMAAVVHRRGHRGAAAPGRAHDRPPLGPEDGAHRAGRRVRRRRRPDPGGAPARRALAQRSVRLLLALGDLLVGWLLLRPTS